MQLDTFETKSAPTKPRNTSYILFIASPFVAEVVVPVSSSVVVVVVLMVIVVLS